MLAAALLLAACGGGPDPRETLVGRWEQGTDRVEFFADGHVLLLRAHWRALGTYAMVEPRRVVMAFGAPLAAAQADDYRVRVSRDTARLCETYRPHRCMALARTRSDWIEGPGQWADTVPMRLADPPRLADLPVIAPAEGPASRLEERPAPVDPGRVTVPAQARAAEAGPTLKQLYTLQKTYQAEFGAYARTLEELAQVGWQAHALRHFRTPRIAGAEEGRLCIDIEPRAAELWAQHVDESGRLGRGRCP